jgi:regulator of nonsense transcripts 1
MLTVDQPYSYGHLNDETVILLNALGISHEVLLKKQDDHFNLLANATSSYQDAFRFLSYINRPDLAEKVLLESIRSMKPQVQRLVNVEYSKMLNKKSTQRCRIFVLQSRLLFGVCDAWGVLEEGECAVKVTMENNGQAYTLNNTEVLVTRNPCLHPGDLQKFRVVHRPELSHLVDCIVFSTKGERPGADLMSGGDLDGDQCQHFILCSSSFFCNASQADEWSSLCMLG